ncbi:MAG: GNAT family N-acetyltransferase [Legionellales bacterium]|nr:GNAT family N-acetyltransferase [Legionellales bacterium]
MDEVNIQEATTKEKITICYPVISILRNNLTEETFLAKIQTIRNSGYHLMYIPDQSSEMVISVLGYRIFDNLAWGKIFYIDDISTLPAYRNKGFASKLLDWSIQKARNSGCEQLHLDAGFDKQDAHRLYLKYNFNFSCHHMAMIL